MADSFVNAIGKNQIVMLCVLFDKYTAKSSMTGDTRQQRTGVKSLYKPAYKVEDSTQNRDCLVGRLKKTK